MSFDLLIIDDALNRVSPVKGIFLAAVADQIVRKKAFSGNEAELNERFCIASLTKQFTAVATLKVLAEAQIDPHSVIPAGKVTFHQLLTHSVTGEFQYSNEGYNLLGDLIAEIRGQRLSEIFQELLFTPAGMNDSELPERGEYAAYYASGGVVSSASDLLKWNLALYGGKLLSSEQLHLMTMPHVHKKSFPQYDGFEEGFYGYGLEIYPHCFQHCGGIPGVQTKMTYFPDEQLTLVYYVQSDKDYEPIFSFSNTISMNLHIMDE